MEDDPQRMTEPGPDRADTVAQCDAITATCACFWPLIDSKQHAVALPEGHDIHTRLHAGPLLREDEFSPGEVAVRARQQNGKLDRKNMLPVKILMQAVIITWSIS
ncbi:hypothetical protein MSKU9_2698 [Komagataeibacter diospyri]|uniref:Uncharacterized protein n=1 Tax=Komagataeibacter diospyri TaxID=1932662 RepID=A0A4P5NW06_9PROT|nr:hypothetical protein MSKU9_2698 [Komagataeibacter diospyri]